MSYPPNVPPPAPAPANPPLHKTKLYALILAALGLVGMILPWASINMGFGGSRSSGNGFQGWGILSLFGLIAVVVASLVGEKLRDYDVNMRYLAIGGFSGLALGALIAFMQFNGNAQLGVSVKSGIGIWFVIIAGVLGVLWTTGVIKLNSSPKPPPYNYPPGTGPQPPYPPQQYPPQQYPPQYPNPPYPPQQHPPNTPPSGGSHPY